MAFTRFHDDPIRIQKQLQESTGLGRYQLDKPGPGANLPFIEDPQIRLQSWGANLHSNAVNLESDLRGMTRKLSRDQVEYKSTEPMNLPGQYSSVPAFVDESRATHPAWMFRDLEQNRWGHTFHDVQSKTEIPFMNNEHTRILEKTHFIRTLPVVGGNYDTDFFLTGKTMCMGGNCV
jgi:hypothetical protein